MDREETLNEHVNERNGVDKKLSEIPDDGPTVYDELKNGESLRVYKQPDGTFVISQS